MTDQWIGLDLRHLTALQAIADEGSFKGAARVLGYTPSAISQQIASLERIVGVRVIAREHGRQALGPTEAGRILLRHLTSIESSLGAAKAEIEAFTQGAVGTIRVGAYESVEARLVPGLVARFAERFPNAQIEVDNALSDFDLMRSLERGILDLAFTLVPLPDGPFDSRIVLRDRWVLVAEAGSQLARTAGGSPPSLRKIAELPLVSFRAERAIGPVLDRFRAAGIEPNVLMRSDYNDAVQEFAAEGLGVALMPRLAVNAHDDRIVIVELGGVIPHREVAVAWHNGRATSEAFTTLVSIAEEVGGGLEEEDRPRDGEGWQRAATG